MHKNYGATIMSAQAVISDVSNFVAKFNNGQVDMVGAPAYAYKPLEIYKGLGTNGAMFNFPVLQVTADFIIRLINSQQVLVKNLVIGSFKTYQKVLQ